MKRDIAIESTGTGLEANSCAAAVRYRVSILNVDIPKNNVMGVQSGMSQING